jgi:hypothetical protein
VRRRSFAVDTRSNAEKRRKAPTTLKTAATILMAFGQVKVSRLPLKYLKSIGLLALISAGESLRQCAAAAGWHAVRDAGLPAPCAAFIGLLR